MIYREGVHLTTTRADGPVVLLGLDWGTSSCRVWALDARGSVVEELRSDRGCFDVSQGALGADSRDDVFRTAFLEIAGDLVTAYPSAPIVACGMVGSTVGWREAGYVETPTAFALDRTSLTRVDALPGRDLWIIPGLRHGAGQPGGFSDVIRGEETQVLGALAELDASGRDQLVILPGTHTKWVHVRDGLITSFRTAVTGELFRLLAEQSIFSAGDGTASVTSDKAFARGLALASDDSDLPLAARVFAARTLVLDGEMQSSEVRDLLSGILIGDEVRHLLQTANVQDMPIALCGSPEISGRYAQALEFFGRSVVDIGEYATARGIAQIAAAARLISAPSPVTRVHASRPITTGATR